MTRLVGLLRAYWPLIPLCGGVFIAADDQTVVATVLPDILIDLEVPVSDLDRASWTITGYLIGYAAAMPFMGRASDRYGHRATFAAAMAIFMLGSALVAVSPALPGFFGQGGPDLRWMVGARVFQAVGGGAVVPISIAAVADLLPGNRHMTAYGLIGASAEAGGVIGPLWGGAITNLWSWEWAFWLNIPLASAVLAALVWTPRGTRRPVRIDLLGAAMFAAFLTLLTAGLTRAASVDLTLILLIGGAVAAAAALAWRQLAAADPILPRGLAKALSFGSANLAHMMIGAALIIAMVTVPLMANTVVGASPLEGGLRLLRMTAAVPVGALAGGIATQRLGPRLPAVAGLLLIAAGLGLMSRWNIDVADPWMTVHLAIAGIGFGLLIAPISASALSPANPSERGAASAFVTVSRMLGMTFGLAAITAWGAARFGSLAEGLPPFSIDPLVQQQLAEGLAAAGMTVFRGFFAAGAALALAAIAPAILMSRWRRPRSGY